MNEPSYFVFVSISGGKRIALEYFPKELSRWNTPEKSINDLYIPQKLDQYLEIQIEKMNQRLVVARVPLILGIITDVQYSKNEDDVYSAILIERGFVRSVVLKLGFHAMFQRLALSTSRETQNLVSQESMNCERSSDMTT